MGRAPCCDKANVKKGPWSPEEDAKLKAYIEQNGTGGNWIALPQKIGLKRCGKSCRLRWLNYLRPNIKHGGFSEEEDNIICSLYISIGSRWSIIAAQLPGRTDNDIKNYWNTRLKKKLLGKQRREQTQARRANNNLIKQEILMKRETENSFHFLPGFLMSQTPPYWQDNQLPHVSLSPAVANPNYYNPPQLIKDEDQAASIKNLLIKLGGRFSDIQTQTKTTDFHYPMVDISCAPQDQVFAHHDQQLASAEYDAGSTMFQGLENLQAELSELIYSNPAPQIDGSQSFYGIDHNMDVNGGSTSTTTTTTITSITGGADSGSWGEMNNSFVYPPMVSDYQ